MANIEYKPVWSEDGQTLSNVLVKDKLETYNITDVWYDGTPIDDSKLDSDLVYVKYEGRYLVRNFEYGQVLQKDTMQEMRDLSSYEILLLKMGVYKHVQLNGYYEKGDTPSPINYTLSDTEDEDDGGRVIEVAGIKLEHKFGNEVNVLYFGAGKSPTQDVTQNLRNAIENSPYGRVVILPNRGEGHRYRVSGTIVVGDNITIRGEGITDQTWGVTTNIQMYSSHEDEPVFKVVGKNVIIEYLSINSGRSAGKDYVGLDITGGRHSHFKYLYLFRAKYGILIRPEDTGYYSIYERISCQVCDIGIYMPTGLGSDINATYIKSPLFMYNRIGAYLGSGTGSNLDFGGCEIGKNDDKDIELAGGNWGMVNSSWGEVSPIGIHATGGFHTMAGDIRISNHIIEDGGFVVSNSIQTYSDLPRSAIHKKDCKFWFSFDEQKGNRAYCRYTDKKLTLRSDHRIWKDDEGQFKTSLQILHPLSVPSTLYSMTLSDFSDIDLSKSWTLLINVKDLAPTTNSNVIFSARKGDNRFRIRVRGDWVSTDINDSSFNIITIHGGDNSRNRHVWVVVYYDSEKREYGGMTAGGYKHQETENADLSMFREADSIILGKDDWDRTADVTTRYSFDEYIMYNRLLTPHEVNAITHNKYLPKNNNFIYEGVTQIIDLEPISENYMFYSTVTEDRTYVFENYSNSRKFLMNIQNNSQTESTVNFTGAKIISGSNVIEPNGEVIVEIFGVRGSPRVVIHNSNNE